eukprot:m51a1_g12323 hypothetical protein (1685) ;mRNA; f:431058-437728
MKREAAQTDVPPDIDMVASAPAVEEVPVPSGTYTVTGFSAELTTAFSNRLKALKCTVETDIRRGVTTHVIALRPRTTTKCFQAFAAGLWMLKPAFVDAWEKTGVKPNELDYEWTAADAPISDQPPSASSMPGRTNLVSVYGAGRMCREFTAKTGHGIFLGMVASLYFRPEDPKKDFCKQAIEIGGGEVVPVSLSLKQKTVTHVVVGSDMSADNLAASLQHAKCVSMEYVINMILVDYVYYLVLQMLRSGPCSDAADALAREAEAAGLLRGGLPLSRTREQVEALPGDALRFMLGSLVALRNRTRPGTAPPILGVLDRAVARAPDPIPGLVCKSLLQRELGTLGPEMTLPTVVSHKYRSLCRVTGHFYSRPVYNVRFDSTGQFLFSGADDTTIKCWRASDMSLLYNFKGHVDEIEELAVSPCSKFLVSNAARSQHLRVWDLTERKLIKSITCKVKVCSFSFCPDAQRELLVALDQDSMLYGWSSKTWETLFAVDIGGKTKNTLQMSWSGDGTLLSVAGRKYISVFRSNDLAEIGRIQDKASLVFFSNSGREFVTADTRQPTIYRINAVGEWVPIILERIPEKKFRAIQSLWSKNDSLVITSHQDGHIKVWDATTGEMVWTFEGHRKEAWALEMHPHDPRVLLSAGHDGLVFLWDMLTGSQIACYAAPIEGSECLCSCFSPDGSFFAVSYNTGMISLFGTGTTQPYARTPREQFFQNEFHQWDREPELGFPVSRITQRMFVDFPAGSLCNAVGEAYRIQPDPSLAPGMAEFVDDEQAITRLRSQIANEVGLAPPTIEEEEAAAAAAAVNAAQAYAQEDEDDVADAFAGDCEQDEDFVEHAGADDEDEDEDDEDDERPRSKPRAAHNAAARTHRYNTRHNPSGDAREYEGIEIDEDESDGGPVTRLRSRTAHVALEDEDADPEAYRPHRRGRPRAPAAPHRRREEEAAVAVRQSSRLRSKERVRFIEPSSDEAEDDEDFGGPPAAPTRSLRSTRSSGPPAAAAAAAAAAPEADPVAAMVEAAAAPGQGQPFRPIKMSRTERETLHRQRKAPWIATDTRDMYTAYRPQIGDSVVYFALGHHKYNQTYAPPGVACPWEASGQTDVPCTVTAIEYVYFAATSVCKLTLTPKDASLAPCDNIFYHDGEVPNFLVLEERLELAKRVPWEEGRRFRMYFPDENAWAQGVIVSRSPSDPSAPNSLWECLEVKWDANESCESTRVSPWEVSFDDNRDSDCLQTLPEQLKRFLKERLRTVVTSRPQYKQLCEPIDVVANPGYLQCNPFPIDFRSVAKRVNNGYYRTLDHFAHELSYVTRNSRAIGFPDVREDTLREIDAKCAEIVGEARDLLASLPPVPASASPQPRGPASAAPAPATPTRVVAKLRCTRAATASAAAAAAAESSSPRLLPFSPIAPSASEGSRPEDENEIERPSSDDDDGALEHKAAAKAADAEEEESPLRRPEPPSEDSEGDDYQEPSQDTEASREEARPRRAERAPRPRTRDDSDEDYNDFDGGESDDQGQDSDSDADYNARSSRRAATRKKAAKSRAPQPRGAPHRARRAQPRAVAAQEQEQVGFTSSGRKRREVRRLGFEDDYEQPVHKRRRTSQPAQQEQQQQHEHEQGAEGIAMSLRPRESVRRPSQYWNASEMRPVPQSTSAPTPPRVSRRTSSRHRMAPSRLGFDDSAALDEDEEEV